MELVVGGVAIGLSAVLLMLLLGRIAGISGIVWGAITGKAGRNDRAWRWLFLAGLLLGTFLLHAITGKPVPDAEGAPLLASFAGLLVGIGVKISNGCTSGHGVCGLGRLSFRSLVSVGLFMGAAIITVAAGNLIARGSW